jgi:hypothetical protein
MFETLLKYVFPDSATALQRVAVRQAAIFLCAVGVATVLAFGQNTFGILSYYVGRFAGMEQADVPQTTAALTVAALMLLYLLASLLYACRNRLLRFWSGSWSSKVKRRANPLWLFSIIEDFKRGFETDQHAAESREEERSRRLIARYEFVTGLREGTASLVQRAQPGEEDLPSWQSTLPERAGEEWVDWVFYVAGFMLVPLKGIWVGWKQLSRWLQVQIVALMIDPAGAGLDALFDRWGDRIGVKIRREVPGKLCYEETAKRQVSELRLKLDELLAALKELARYLASDEAKAPEPQPGKDKEPRPYPIESLAIECTMVDDIRKVIGEIIALYGTVKARAMAEVWNDLSVELDRQVDELGKWIFDKPMLPWSRDPDRSYDPSKPPPPATFRPRTDLGFVFERCSLGLGQRDLEVREGSGYFASAQHKTEKKKRQKKQESNPSLLTDVNLKQCITLREQAYSAVIGATLALVFLLIVPVAGFWFALPTVLYSLVWVALALASLVYMASQLAAASIAGATLSSMESRLWQEAFPSPQSDPPRAIKPEPKPILWLTAPWRSQLPSQSWTFFRLAAAAAIPFLLMSWFPDLASIWLHRVDLVPVARLPIENQIKLTERNLPVLIKFQPELVPWASNLPDPDKPPSASALIDTVLGGCIKRKMNPDGTPSKEASGEPLRIAMPITPPATPVDTQAADGAAGGSKRAQSFQKLIDLLVDAMATYLEAQAAGADSSTGTTTPNDLKQNLRDASATPDSFPTGAGASTVTVAEPELEDCRPYLGLPGGASGTGGKAGPVIYEPQPLHLVVHLAKPGDQGPGYQVILPAPEVKFVGTSTSKDPLPVRAPYVLFPEPGVPIGTLDVKGPYVMFPEPGAPIGTLDVKGPYVMFPEPGKPIGSLDVKGPYVMFPEPGTPIGPLAVKAPDVTFSNEPAPAAPLKAVPPELVFAGPATAGGLIVIPPSPGPGGSPPPPRELPEALLLPPVLPVDIGGDGFTRTPGRSLWFNLYCPQIPNDPHLCSGPGELNNEVNALAGVSRSEIIAFVRRQKPNAQYFVLGHVDLPDESGLNDQLAEARAERGAELLRLAGVDDRQIRLTNMKYYGPWIPQHDPKEPQSLNRRVDIYVFDPRVGD